LLIIEINGSVNKPRMSAPQKRANGRLLRATMRITIREIIKPSQESIVPLLRSGKFQFQNPKS